MSLNFVVGADGSEAGKRALVQALEQARGRNARLIIVHAIEWSRYEIMNAPEAAIRHQTREQEIAQANELILEPIRSALGDEEVDFETMVRHGHPAEVLAQIATETGASQIFVGRHGHSRLGAMLFGSVAFTVSQTSPVPVVVVP